MGCRNIKKEERIRLESKSLDSQFCTEIQQGLNCSPFEAEAVLEVVKEVYSPYLDISHPHAPPGKITVVAIQADEPAGKPVGQCQKQTVALTLHRGAADDRILQEKGAAAFRQSRIPELCQDAMSQGALLTREDLAYRIFFVSPRTITRDLAELRRADPQKVIPLRGAIQDIGPVMSHRVEIIRLALHGKTLTQICRATHHSPAAAANYLSTFTRCAQLNAKGMERKQIAFLLSRGEGLIQRYLDLLEECGADKTMRYHLSELLRTGRPQPKKKAERRTRR